MANKSIFSEYVEKAMSTAILEQLEDGSFSGRILPCTGVVAFGSTYDECSAELRSTLEDWSIVGLRLGHELPVIGNVDLNKVAVREPLDTVLTARVYPSVKETRI